MVDAVFGDDATASRNGSSFSTVAGALAAARAGAVVVVAPGVHDLAAGVVLPVGVGVFGTSVQQTVLRRAADADTVLVTMGEGSGIQNLTLRLTSAGHHALVGVLFPGPTARTAVVENVRVEVDNSGAESAGTSDVCGVRSTGTGTPAEASACFTGSSVAVCSSGSGRKRGVLVDTNAHVFSCSVVDVVVSRVGAVAGSYVGVEVDAAGATCVVRLGTISGATADVSQTLGRLVLGVPTLVNASANGLGFATIAPIPTFGWGCDGGVPTGTRFLFLGTAKAGMFEPKITFKQRACLLDLTVTARTGPGGNREDVWTLRKNGADTPLAVSRGGGATFAVNDAVSVTYQAGDQVSVMQVGAVGSATTDVQVTVSYA